MKSAEKLLAAAGAGIVAWVLFILFLLVGWVMNIFKLAGLLLTDQPFVFTGEIVMRLVGIFPPVGGVVGWF